MVEQTEDGLILGTTDELIEGSLMYTDGTYPTWSSFKDATIITKERNCVFIKPKFDWNFLYRDCSWDKHFICEKQSNNKGTTFYAFNYRNILLAFVFFFNIFF